MRGLSHGPVRGNVSWIAVGVVYEGSTIVLVVVGPQPGRTVVPKAGEASTSAANGAAKRDLGPLLVYSGWW